MRRAQLLTSTAIGFAVMAIAVFVGSSNGDQGRLQAAAPSPVAPQKWEFSTGSNQFGVALLAELRKKNKDANVVISPASVSVALAMLLNGADGQTLTQSAKLLGVDPKDLLSMNSAVSDFMDSAIQADPDVELEIANGIFSQAGKKIDAKFMKIVQKEFQGRIKELDFNADPKAATAKINDWVSQKTNGKIPTLFDALSKDTVMILANAVYFKSAWTNPFDEGNTTDRDFKLSGGNKISVSTMHQYGSFSYQENADFQAVSLGYGKNGRFCMDVYLPKTNSTLDSLATKLSASALAKHAGNFAPASCDLYLPKMKISMSMKLNDHLVNLGMKDAFDKKKAEFSKLFADKKDRFAVDIVQHKTFLEVNEKGTEAAAATGIGVYSVTSVDTTVPFLMDVNRPFFFVIRDTDTGAILFMGTVYNPTK